MTQEQDKLEKTIGELYTRETAYASACNDAAANEHTFKIKFATEFRKATGSVDLRKQTAMIECQEEYSNHLTADAVRDFTKEKLRDAQAVLSARQSILSATARADFNHAMSRGTT